MWGHALAAEMEDWWKAHGGNSESPQWHKYLDTTVDLMTRAGGKIAELREEHDNHGCFGMSKAGGCTRATSLKMQGYPAEELSGSTRWVFQVGHDCEINVIATLIAMGYSVSGEQAEVTIPPMMHSYRDGTLSGGQFTTPINLSVKSAGYKMGGYDWRKKKWVRRGFPELPLIGIKASQPGWWAQKQAEMCASGLTESLVIVAAKDMIQAFKDDPIMIANGSLAFYAELICYDAAWAKSNLLPIWKETWASAKAGKGGRAMVLNQSGVYVELDPAGDKKHNAGLTGTYSPCEYCPFGNTVGSGACADVLAKEKARVA